MKYRKLGAKGPEVSAVGVGGGGIGQVWGPTTDEECVRTVQRAIELGINFFDVAPSYGRGKAEEILGVAAREHRNRCYYATKVRLAPDQLDDIPAAVESSVRESLHRLQTDYIDLLQIHNPVYRERRGDVPGVGLTDVLGTGGLLESFQRLRQQGIVRLIGFTGYGEYEAVRMLIESGQFDTVQAHYNILHQNATRITGEHEHDPETGERYPSIIPLARTYGLGVIGIRPLAAGALSDAIDRPVDPDTPLGRDARRAHHLHFLIGRQVRTLSQAAIIFVLMNQDIATVVPGVKNLAELEEAAACADADPLSPQAMASIAELVERDFQTAR